MVIFGKKRTSKVAEFLPSEAHSLVGSFWDVSGHGGPSPDPFIPESVSHAWSGFQSSFIYELECF